MLRYIALAALLILASAPSAIAAGKPASPAGAKQLQAAIAGNTVMTSDGRGGIQVEYLKAGGKAYLVNGGSTTIIAGQWSIADGSVCFVYRGDSHKIYGYDIKPNYQGNTASCATGEGYLKLVIETAKGDPLGLSKGGLLPKSLSRSKTTIAKLVEKMGQ